MAPNARELLVDSYVILSRLLDNVPPADPDVQRSMARHLMGLISRHLYPDPVDSHDASSHDRQARDKGDFSQD